MREKAVRGTASSAGHSRGARHDRERRVQAVAWLVRSIAAAGTSI